MLFHFELRPFNKIAPWGPVTNPDARTPEYLRRPHLGWFELTDGWYWLETGQGALLRYSEACIEVMRAKYPGAPWTEPPYVDYQVSRLWEDVLDILPWVLSPIPEPLTHVLRVDGLWRDWQTMASAAIAQARPQGEIRFDERLYCASRWHGQRSLFSGYLMAGPDIWFWSDGTEMHIQWDNRDCELEGVPAWEATLGQMTLSVKTFMDEVRSFDRRFIRRMADRVAIVQCEWSRPEALLDPNLAAEQVARTHALQQTLDAGTAREPDNWKAVLGAIERIQALPTFPPEAALRLK